MPDDRKKDATTPMVIDEKIYRYIFGDSSDEEEQEFYGFEEEELGLKEFRSVISPRRLKLQEDFYLPLFLSHRKRKRCLNYEKVDCEEKSPYICSTPNITNDKSNVSDLKQPIQFEAKDVSSTSGQESLAEGCNPYAKQYKSYRKSRSRSPVTSVSEKEKNDIRLQENVTGLQKHDTSHADIDGKKGSDLKLRIQYQVNSRPKRSVSMPENKDFVYDASFSSSKKQRNFSPPVITGAKIVEIDDPDDTANEIVIENQETDTVSHAFSKDHQKSKRKKRFKNFRSSNEGYPRAVFSDILSSDSNEDPGCITSSQNVELFEIDARKDAAEHVQESKSHEENDDTNVEKQGRSDLVVGRNDEEGEDLECNNDSMLASSGIPSKDTLSNVADRVDKESDFTDCYKTTDEHVLSPEVTNRTLVSEDIKSKTRFSDEEKLFKERKEGVERSIGKIVSVSEDAISKGRQFSNESNKYQKNLAAKAKSINLTDTWFSAASVLSKKKNRISKTKHQSADSCAKDESQQKNELESSVTERKNFLEKVEKDTSATLQNRTPALGRRRRLKNVTYRETDEEFLSINARKTKDSETKEKRDEPNVKQVACICGKLLESKPVETKISATEFKIKTNYRCEDCAKQFEEKQNRDKPGYVQFAEKKDNLKDQKRDTTEGRMSHSDLYADCELTVTRDKTSSKWREDDVAQANQKNVNVVKSLSVDIDEREDGELQKSTAREGQHNRFSRKEKPKILDDKAASQVIFSQPESVILPDQTVDKDVYTNTSKTPNEKEDERKNENIEGVQQSICSAREGREKRSLRSAIKSDMKINKNKKSGRSFIIRTAVDDPSKQITLMDKPCENKKRSRSESNKEASDSDNSDDFEESSKQLSNDMHNRVQDSKVDGGKKIKRKIYTVVRKIRRTEVNADGKKVTKIIKQIVKKVCPVVCDDDGNEVVDESDGLKMSDHDKDRNALKSRTLEDHVTESATGHPKQNLSQRCGKCIGCLRKEDCGNCDSCRRMNEIESDDDELSDVAVCSKKRCVNIQSLKKPKLTSRKKEPSKDKTSCDEKAKSKPSNSDSKTGLNKQKKATEASTKTGKPKPKNKIVKNVVKVEERKDVVYSPGFKLRSKVNDTMKVAPGRVLKQVQYSGLQPTVKLPWPEEESEHSAFDSSHFFCITSPIAIRAKDICFHCGSGGYLKMIYCIECSEAYHDFCIDIDPLDENNWLCDRCKKCNVCGIKDNLLMCDHCHDCYHAECLGPNYHKNTEGDDELWVCGKCVKCSKCGTRTPGKRKDSKWMKNFTVCEECERRLRRGQYCLICEKVYSENDYETKMMYCTICKKWIHMECEGLNTDEYECLAELPDNIPYICKLCHQNDTWPTWYQEVREEINAGFEKIYYEFLASSDYKIIRKNVSEFRMSFLCQKLENIFSLIQQNKFKTVADFVAAFQDYLKDLAMTISEVLPSVIITDIRTSFNKQLKSLFPWIVNVNKNAKEIKAPITEEKIGTEVPFHARPVISLDHPYHTNTTENNGNRKCDNDNDKGKENENICSKEVEEMHTSDESSTQNFNDNIFDKLLCFEPNINKSNDIDEKFHFTKIEIHPDSGSSNNEIVGDKSGKIIGNSESPVPDVKEKARKSEAADVQLDNCDLKKESTRDSGVDNEAFQPNNFDDDVSQDDNSITAEATIRTAKHNDDRRCLLCNQYGDEPQDDAGRILSAGVNEWVHVNCALWSAEVYESDSGLLQNVHTAIARGQKLRCSLCQQWGATVGCCASNCPSNYHFMCARNDDVLFQDNKIVYCQKHKNKSKNQALLVEDGFAVLRPVLVDMSKVLGQKKFNVDRDPDSVILYSGSLTVHRLGRLSESSDGNQALLPIGFRATRIFWDAKDCRRRCKYHLSIEETEKVNDDIQNENMEIMDDIVGGCTVCHDSSLTKRKPRRKLSETRSPLQNKRMKIDCNEKNTTNASNNSTKSHSSDILLSSLPATKTETKATQTFNVDSKTQLYKSLSSTESRDLNIANRCTEIPSLLTSKSNTYSQSVVSQTQPIGPKEPGSLDYNRTPIIASTATVSGVNLMNHSAVNTKSSSSISSRQTTAVSSMDNGSRNGNAEDLFGAVSVAQTSLASDVVGKPYLVQPQLRYELYPKDFGMSSKSCNILQKPVVQKCDDPSSNVLHQLQQYLAKNPHMFNFIGNTTLKGLNLETSDLNSAVNTSVEKNLDASSPIPCYSLNLPEEYVRALAPHTSHGLQKGQMTTYITSHETSVKDESKNTVLPDISNLINELPRVSLSSNDLANRSANMCSTLTKGSWVKDVDSEKENKTEIKKNKKWYLKKLQRMLANKDEKKKSCLSVVVKNDEGLRIQGDSIEDVWKKLISLLNETRMDQKIPQILFNEQEALDFFGLSKFPLVFLTEQLPGGHKCRNYKFQYHLPCLVDEDKELPVNPHGCARAEVYTRHSHGDMFSWLASPYRALPCSQEDAENESEIKSSSDLPLSMRFRQLKSSVKDHVGVYRSLIHGRGLFCKRKIEAGEMVIEYAGSVIRGTLTDKRENYYDGKGYGCYMFRIDGMNVVDATLFGNEARFINHSCEPNCYSRIVPVDGTKHIIIFASRRILPGEELTYDYKFPFEEEKLPCHCGSKRCRKYLN